jgi:hypothetical protein
MSDTAPEPSCSLTVRVTPRARSNRLETVGDTVKIWVTAAPTDGHANEAVRELLSAQLKIPYSRIILVRGATSRTKTFRIEGLSAVDLNH